MSGDGEGAACGCSSEHEHKELVARVDASYEQDDDRSRVRQERNTYALRASVLAQSNGHGH